MASSARHKTHWHECADNGTLHELKQGMMLCHKRAPNLHPWRSTRWFF